MSEGYISIREQSLITIEQKKSKFIGLASPVESSEQAEEAIERARTLYPDATHHCYAYRAGLEGTTVRFSDDREPQGTAGRPILDVIERHELDNVCVVVVRYYGGIQLGAAGLTRAYRAAAAEAVDEAGIVHYVLHLVFEGDAPYADWSRVERLLTLRGVQNLQTEFHEKVRFQATIPKEEFEVLATALKDESAGAVQIRALSSTFAPTDS